MKDEEMAEEKYCKGCKWRIEQCLWAWRRTNGLKEPNEKNCSCKEVPAFLAGLKAGRPQWHDLRKAPTDLPDDTYDVLDQAGYKVHYNFFQNVWVNEKDEIDEHVIAWCEIPTFDKE